MVSALVPGASGPCSTPGRGHCVMFLGKTLNSHCASLHPGELAPREVTCDGLACRPKLYDNILIAMKSNNTKVEEECIPRT